MTSRELYGRLMYISHKVDSARVDLYNNKVISAYESLLSISNALDSILNQAEEKQDDEI